MPQNLTYLEYCNRVKILLFFLTGMAGIFSQISPVMSQDAGFEVRLLNLPEKNPNTLLYLLTPEDKGAEVDITIRKATNRAIVKETEKKLPGNGLPLNWSLELPPGEYLFEFELSIPGKNPPRYKSLRYLSADPQVSFLLSTISIGPLKASGSLLIGDEIPSGTHEIPFNVEISAKNQEVTTIRAALFKKSINPTGTFGAEKYSAVSQINRIVPLKKGKATFSEAFQTPELEAGSYLIEVYLFHKEERVADANTRFTVNWKPLDEIFNNLENSIKQMTPTTDPAIIERLLAIQNPVLQKEKFLEFWQKRNLPGAERGTEALESYYKRILFANIQFGEQNRPGWQTDRGLTYLRFGLPENISGTSPVIWLYPGLGLKFVFIEKAGQYYLANPENIHQLTR